MSRPRRPSRKRREGERGSGARAVVGGLFERAREVHRAGDLPAARQLYERYLDQRPEDAAALHLLGFAEFQSFQFVRAVELLEKAVALRPDQAEYHNSLALALLALRQWDAARREAQEARNRGHTDGHGYWHVGMEFIRRADWNAAEVAMCLGILVQPDAPEAHNGLGIVLAAQGRLEAAARCYRDALACDAGCVEALNNLGNLLREQQRPAEAVPLYRDAIARAPEFAAAHVNLGIALADLGRLDEAMACYQRALQWQPEGIEALNNLGNAFRDQGDDRAAIACYRQALQRQPASPEIESNLGVALRRDGRVGEAIAHFRRAIVAQPRSFRIHHHLATSLVEAGRLPEAAACFRHLERLAAAQGIWRLQSRLLCPAVFSSRAEMDAYWEGLPGELAAAWELAARCESRPVKLAEAPDMLPAPPFHWQFHHGCVREIKETYARIIRTRLPTVVPGSGRDAWPGPRRSPRVGIVVTEGHDGIFLSSLRGMLPRIRGFELIVFGALRDAARLQRELGQDGVRIATMPARFELAVRSLQEAQCDLLYYWEVGTDAWNYLLPMFRLAPVQVTSWGIQVTSGLSTLDGYLSTQLVEPPQAASHYTERLFLADTFLTYRERSIAPAPLVPREAFALPSQSRWYVCAQQIGKIHVDFDRVLGGILRSDPQGIVVLVADSFEPSNRRLRERFRQTIPDVEGRIHLIPRLARTRYLGLLQQADVLLDPFPFGGVNSTYDGLSLGRGIVVLPTEFHRGRYTMGCYRKMGIADCIAVNEEDYVRRAVRLANDLPYRRAVEEGIFEAGHSLFANLASVREQERLWHEVLAAGRRS